METARPWKVLVVDDDPEACILARTLLELDGRFRVSSRASNGRVAVVVAAIDQPDAIVLDLAMPGMDGWAALPELRRVCPGAAIVVTSAFPDPVTLAEVVSLGADEYLNKGTSWRELAPVLAALCQSRAELGGYSSGTPWDRRADGPSRPTS
ncbi:MAG TPA: response regulator [Acidimicrobiales bacterium]|nr:response regulator [Acidimicrobiales bacterium]